LDTLIFLFILWLLYQYFTGGDSQSGSGGGSGSNRDPGSSRGTHTPSLPRSYTPQPLKTTQRSPRLDSKRRRSPKPHEIVNTPAEAFTDDYSDSIGHLKTKLYYVKIKKSGKTYYKIGITAKDNVLRRFDDEIDETHTDGLRVDVIKTWTYPNRSEALKKEQYILAMFDEHRLYGAGPLTHGGNSEVFDEDVLALEGPSGRSGAQSRISEARAYLTQPERS
jgi:hypothetical protein